MLKRAAALFLVGVSTASWIGCGTTTSHYLYAALPGPSQLAAFREDPNSDLLTTNSGRPFTSGPAAQSVVIHPSGKFLYVANSGESDISLFTLASGVPTEVTPRTPAGTAPVLMVMDTAGAYLYVANTGANISAFSINASTGALTAVGSPFLIGIAPLNMKLSPSGNVLYITGAGSSGGVIEAFSVSAGAFMNVVPGSPFPTGTNPYGLAMTPNGSFLYTANNGDNSISEFSVAANGSLTQISGSPVGETYSAPLALLVDNSGKYLYVANEGSSNLGAYTIGSDGTLTILTNSPFTTGAQPAVITADQNGKYLFVGNQSGAAIEVFSLDTSSGTLTEVSNYPIGNTPTSIAVQ